jgi:hypothetical protein
VIFFIFQGGKKNNIWAMRTYNKDDHWLAYVIRVLGSQNKKYNKIS